MPRKLKVEEPIETPVVEEVATPVISEEAQVISEETPVVSEEVAIAPEEVKVEAPLPTVEVEEGFGTIGPRKLKITKVMKKEINGIAYNEITLEDRTTYLLSDRDLELQVNK